VGGPFTSGPGATCLPSTTTVELVERGVDLALWQATAFGT
jgi:hypothetical protein